MKRVFIYALVAVVLAGGFIINKKYPSIKQDAQPIISGSTDKPTLKIKFANVYAGLSLETFPMFKEIFEERYDVVMDHNNFDVVINLPYDNGPVDYKDAVKMYYTGEVVAWKTGGKKELTLKNMI